MQLTLNQRNAVARAMTDIHERYHRRPCAKTHVMQDEMNQVIRSYENMLRSHNDLNAAAEVSRLSVRLKHNGGGDFSVTPVICDPVTKIELKVEIL